MRSHSLLLSVAVVASSHKAIAGRIQDIRPNKAPSSDILMRRQSDDFPYNETSICLSYGIDFQNGGSYFIDSRLTESFTVVSQFDGCEPNTSAYVLLVNDATGDQLECSGVATTPDLTNVISTCPITKNQMTSGDWSILVIGNNGDGSPYAWERDFELTVGVPTTSTTTSTVTYTQTTTPSTTVTTTSTDQTTTSVPNTSTVIIPAATKTITVTPKAQTITSTKWLTRTINIWTRTQSKITKTVVPSCTVPPRQNHPDPTCHIQPTIIPLPSGLSISVSKNKRADNAVSLESIRKRFENLKSHKARLAREAEKRSPDAPIIYVQAPDVFNITTTATAPASTVSVVLLTTLTATVTNPPSTIVSGTKTISTTLPTKTKTITVIGYTTITTTKTMAVTWTYTTTVIPSASASTCKTKGGHYGIL